MTTLMEMVASAREKVTEASPYCTQAPGARSVLAADTPARLGYRNVVPPTAPAMVTDDGRRSFGCPTCWWSHGTRSERVTGLLTQFDQVWNW